MLPMTPPPTATRLKCETRPRSYAPLVVPPPLWVQRVTKQTLLPVTRPPQTPLLMLRTPRFLSAIRSTAALPLVTLVMLAWLTWLVEWLSPALLELVALAYPYALTGLRMLGLLPATLRPPIATHDMLPSRTVEEMAFPPRRPLIDVWQPRHYRSFPMLPVVTIGPVEVLLQLVTATGVLVAFDALPTRRHRLRNAELCLSSMELFGPRLAVTVPIPLSAP